MKKKTPLRKSRPFKELLRGLANYALVHGVFFVATHNGKVAVFGVKVYAAISLMVLARYRATMRVVGKPLTISQHTP
jgi:hypothetical protein